MEHVFNQTPLYKFLSYCNHEGLERSVLDCGAGGPFPPLALFKQFDYQTYGIELNDGQIKKASIFAINHNLALNIRKGDIRNLPFNDHSISYIYSYNTIFHMKKDDIVMAINEMKRVLKTGGLCFINFLSIHDEGFGEGEI
ncbi:class I SAM-dependent methyltransferase [Paraliobacillus salinarum]|uniref:class I SAM-dependent methyltransferase n=1 Tax=Paraliobacillus salinarum TaxID=1158996 RepID=UPI001FE59FCE|nr:class I SAM-dependent methyltransferase [Paraliobacillus salinarum]